MKIIDSNIIIYSALNENKYLRNFLKDTRNYTSLFSKLEVLGYHNLQPSHKIYFENVFYCLNILPFSEEIIEKAIELRQIKKMTAGDSIIASTAIINNLEIITRNTIDFEWIRNLKITNPFI